MTKKDFLSDLSKSLKRMPQSEITKSTDFYSELIEDKIEDGMSEADAIESLGSSADVAKKIIDESPFRNLYSTSANGTSENTFYSENTSSDVNHKQSRPTWVIVLLSITAIVWVPLAFALIVSIWAVLFAAVVSVLAIALSGLFVVITSPIAFVQLGTVGGFMAFGVGLVLLGIGILDAILTIYTVKGVIYLTKKIFHDTKKGFGKGGNN